MNFLPTLTRLQNHKQNQRQNNSQQSILRGLNMQEQKGVQHFPLFMFILLIAINQADPLSPTSAVKKINTV